MNLSGKAGIWVAMLVCAALIVGAMGWLTHEVMSAERERSLADARAGLEERIRLSLWRMDSRSAALMVEENQRSIVGNNQLPENPLVKHRFKVDALGEITMLGNSTPEELAKLKGLMAESEEFNNRFEMACAAAHLGSNIWLANSLAIPQTPTDDGNNFRQSAEYQQELNLKERAVRGGAVNNVVSKSGYGNQAIQTIPIEPVLTAAGMFQPAWIGGEAFLLRTTKSVSNGVFNHIEGTWLDATAFRNMLLEEVHDLLPDAQLTPTEPGLSDALALASFPWRLVPGEQAVASNELRGPLVNSLTVGWVAVAAALLAAAALVQGILRLSERRASFVSAVTHELRTPLTTFRLYSDMLDSGAVTDEGKRTGYFRTLRREADRLSHLVENVLAFSRIERGSARSALKEQDLESLLEGMRERFEERLAGAGMQLRMELDSSKGWMVRADAAALEHVLFNLVDNAAKYAAQGDPPELEIRASKSRSEIKVEIRDHGPGIPSTESGKIFRAFHKSAQAAADSRPGVGLGLALSRRLASEMGGRLECLPSSDGARFQLSLPSGQG